MYRLLPFLFLAYLASEYRSYSSSKYLALGDSLSVGVGAFLGRGYTRLYYNWLICSVKYRWLSYCNLGVLGWTSKDLLDAVTINNNYRNAITNASIITICIGGNDILRNKYSPNKLNQVLECFQYNLYALLKEVRCLNNHCHIYIMDIYNPYPIHHELHDAAEAWVTAFNRTIRSTLRNYEYHISGVANVYAAFKGNEYCYTLIKYNNVHPSTLGYQVICDCFKSITTMK
jgi:lysophospholipase L1-like esterase